MPRVKPAGATLVGVETRLDRFTAARAELAVPHPSGKLVCVACAHRCKLADGARGVCLVRSRAGNAILRPVGVHRGGRGRPDREEAVLPPAARGRALSFGMLGCDLHCAYCQNWFTSQALRDPARQRSRRRGQPRDAGRGGGRARAARSITCTYNEPLITAEWAHDVFVQARRPGLATTFVSNGHATPEVLDYLAPVLDACKVDLKSFSPETYAALGGKLQAVLDTIAGLVDARRSGSRSSR